MYDSNGNRVAAQTPQGETLATYDAQDRLLTYGNIAYTYTRNGELATRTVSGQTTTYTHDSFGNLVAVALLNGTLIEYVIDGLNRRVGKKVNGVLVKGWVYADQLRIVAELDGAGALVSRFLYADTSNSPARMIRGGKGYPLIHDHLGSPRLVVDGSSGPVVQTMEYDEFGRVLQDTNPGFQPFGFAGGLYDPDTKLVRFGARDYDAETGRWTAKDPILFAGGEPNLYSYVMSDPVNLIDPRGLDWIVSVGVSATAGANFGFGIPFIGGGLSIGVNLSTGQFFVQAQGSATVGAGVFAGVGIQGSVAWNCASLPTGLSTQTAGYAELNAGWGGAAGGAVSANAQGIGVSGGRGGRLGIGYGIGAGIGASTSTTYVFGPLW